MLSLGQRIKILLMVLGMVHITIGPSNAFQVVAWSKMLFDYSKGRTFAEAAEMTFDGKHPCSICLALEQTREDDQNDPAPRSERTCERHKLFPQQDILPKGRRIALAANSPPSPARLLCDCRFVSDLPTPPPRFV